MYGKMYKFYLQNSIKSKFSRGTAPDPAGGLTAPPRPPAGFCSHESSWPDWLFFGGYGPVDKSFSQMIALEMEKFLADEAFQVHHAPQRIATY